MPLMHLSSGAAGNIMSRISATYRTLPIISWAAIFLGCSVWLYFAPVTEGRMKGLFRTEDGLTLLGSAVFLASTAITILALTYVFRALAGLPALSSDGEKLSVFVFPFAAIPLSEIDRIVVGGNDVKVYKKNGGKRRINTRLVNDADVFFGSIAKNLI
jgi:hypothetical protein